MITEFSARDFTPESTLRRVRATIRQYGNVKTKLGRLYEGLKLKIKVFKHGHVFRFYIRASNQQNRLGFWFPMGLAEGRLEPNRVPPNGQRTCMFYVRRQVWHEDGDREIELRHVGPRLYVFYPGPLDVDTYGTLSDIMVEICRA
jgi:hypothetical protein